jgi:hypothetical protein
MIKCSFISAMIYGAIFTQDILLPVKRGIELTVVCLCHLFTDES